MLALLVAAGIVLCREVIARDNASVDVSAVAYYRVVDAR